PAAEWLLDNFYLIEEQVRLVRRHLPRGFSRELPHLIAGPNAHRPRVYELALQLIAHVDARVDQEHLTRFVAAYQEVAPLRLGELWAVPIMLRLALIENLRRVSIIVDTARRDRQLAEDWVQRMLDLAEQNSSLLIVAVGEMAERKPNLSSAFVTEFWRRTQERSPAFALALSWIESRLSTDGMTIEQMVHLESQSQASNQVSVGNSISSLRFLDATDWREFVESLSAVEAVLRTDPAAVYPRMDFVTRDGYRHAVERIARYGRLGEAEVAALTVQLARDSKAAGDSRKAHVGYFLTDKGVAELERQAHVRLPLRELAARLSQDRPLIFYVGGIGLVAALVTVAGLSLVTWSGARVWLPAILLLLLGLCASQLAVSVVNWITTILIRPRSLPRLDFSGGVPSDHRTMVVVPTMLTSAAGIVRLVEGLEVHYLANRDDNVFFGLLTDFRDAPEEHLPEDAALVGQVRAGVEALNAKYPQNGAPRFYLFHRNRRWNEQERQWMGYERKRGKLLELNRCLRGNPPHGFSVVVGDLRALPHIRYVITLDTDTQLPRDTARQLAGSMGHILNRPVYDAREGRVVAGYGILQPRVAVSLPSAGRSRFAKLFAGDSGIDPYTRTVSDVYQDLFGEGSFIGKGIYDVDAFDTAVGDKFPENRILSHDLLEGSYARSGLVTDVLLFEEFPSRYTTDTRRRHRWMRGDWQIATWLLPRVPGSDVRRMANPINGLSRWKIFDNLRRSLSPVALLGLLMVGWITPNIATLPWTLFITLLILVPGLLTTLTGLVRKPRDLPPELHLRNVLEVAELEAGHALFTIVFLPFDACISLDATLRTLGRLLFTRRHLLEWQTASDVEAGSETSFVSYLRAMWFVPAMAIVLGFAFPRLNPSEKLVSIPFLLLWLGAPAVAWWISRPLCDRVSVLSGEQNRFLRRLARRTWAFFETYVGPKDNWLPPDNFQEHPQPLIATRTSPTNIGMALLSTLAAWDLGHVSTSQLLHRISACFETLGKMDRYRGHFYNWYDTRTLQPLPPLYISTVDNGNCAGLLLALQAGLADLAADPGLSPAPFEGLGDTLEILLETTPKTAADQAMADRLRPLGEKFKIPPAGLGARRQLLRETLASLIAPSNEAVQAEFNWWRLALERQCQDQLTDLERFSPWLRLEPSFAGPDAAASPVLPALQTMWEGLSLTRKPSEIREFLKRLNELTGALAAANQAVPSLAGQLRAELGAALELAAQRTAQLDELARLCAEFAEMDFGILYDPSRELFSIGYSVANHRLDSGCYDLLASEARLTSFVAIALGQVPQDHWFALGRLLTAVGDQPALISWSGSMFEYLMPPLVMPEYEHTLLAVSDRAAVARQISYGKQLNIPWGVSESGYNLTDAQSNYQYRAFGVPGLGFKRGLTDDVVVAPYASVMALLVAPGEACRNLERLR
ncbi:MAG TPA: glucoamylase family protein, partial [Candidatus Limnocylindria bacterium]|nr:glucoamylase family protein [Candidatus Limnocylindria bacterium]